MLIHLLLAHFIHQNKIMKQFNQTFLVFLFVFSLGFSSTAQNHFFTTVPESGIKKTNGKRTIIPKAYRVVTTNTQALTSFLWSLPAEKNVVNRNTAPVMELPTPNGGSAKFRVWESSIQEPGLEEKFPEIRTFLGQGIDDPYATVRFDYTDFGFHAQVLTVNGNYYIDPYSRGDVNNYISYYSTENARTPGFVCNVEENLGAARAANALVTGPCRGTQLYIYRLAVACTHQYATAVGGTTAALLHSAIVTTVNRVVGVYEKDLTLRFVLIANNNLIEFRTAAGDPFTGNDNAGTLINESQTIITNTIGVANFDLGHTFSTGGGGLAGLGVICKPTQKARGITGLPNPVGDDYDIDFVAHEMGHQCGGNHTFNSSAGNCGGGNRNAGTAYEVGSGTTIMGYAGICSGDDIQPHSDPFFHTVSFDEISNYLEAGGATCHVLSATNNTLPVITSMVGNDLNIPLNTPFTLTATATDADGDALTYNWEEWDLGPSTTWGNGNANATSPLFKSRPPKTVGSRTFPDISLINAGYVLTPADNAGQVMNGNKGETRPTVAKNLKFRLTVRDNRAGGGGIVTGGNGCAPGWTGVFQIHTIAGTGPFVVTVPNGGESYAGGSSQTITWNVTGTNVAPINALNVKISLSTDGGLTYPTVISASTANDGSEAVTIPSVATATARIKVEAVDNVFFDVSNANFTITAPASGYTFNSLAPTTVACGSTTAVATLATAVQGSFSTPINLSATGNPAGTNVLFGTNPLAPGNSSTVTLTNVNTLVPGTYNVTVTGVAGAVTQTSVVAFVVSPGVPPAITTQPVASVVCAGSNATFTATSSATGVTYQWQVSVAGGAFTNVTGATSATLTLPAVTPSQDGNQYQVIVSTLCGTSTSTAALLSVSSATAISTQPSDAVICAGNDNTFTVAATGTGLTYQWQQSVTGCSGTFSNIPGATSSTLTVLSITLAQNGFSYRAIITGTCAPTSVTSACATLSVSGSVGIVAQPVSSTVCSGSDATFTITASGSGVNYQWQVSTAGGAFMDIPGATSATLTLPGVTAAQDGNQYQVVLTNPTCSTPSNSSIVTLTVNALPAITTQPASASVCAGSAQTFTAAATGTGVAYQWQVQNNGTGAFVNIPGETSGTLTLTGISSASDGNVYQLVATGTCAPAATSNAAVLTVISPSTISTQPSVSGPSCAGSDVTLTVTATSGGAPSINYQWQVSVAGGAFTDIPGATSATLSLPAVTAASNGNQYQVIVSNATCTAQTISNPITLTVNSLPVVTASSDNSSVCTGTSVTLTADGATTYSWSPGSISGNPVTVNPSVNPSTPGQANPIVYTVTGTDANGCSNTASVTVTANPLPAVTLTATPALTNLVAGQSVLLQAVVNPAGSFVFTWTKDGVIIPNTSDSLRVSANEAGSYAVTAGNASGECANTSDAIAITDSISTRLFIFPNPNEGQFFISYHNPGGISVGRTVTVYDNKGARVYAKALIVGQRYELIRIGLNHAPSGLYVVVLSDGSGNRLATEKVIIRR